MFSSAKRAKILGFRSMSGAADRRGGSSAGHHPLSRTRGHQTKTSREAMNEAAPAPGATSSRRTSESERCSRATSRTIDAFRAEPSGRTKAHALCAESKTNTALARAASRTIDAQSAESSGRIVLARAATRTRWGKSALHSLDRSVCYVSHSYLLRAAPRTNVPSALHSLPRHGSATPSGILRSEIPGGEMLRAKARREKPKQHRPPRPRRKSPHPMSPQRKARR